MNNETVNALLVVAALVLGYLFGSFPSGVFIGKVFYHKDPRDFGSNNSGGTNTGRVLGYKAGFFTIVLDMLKILGPFYAFWAVLAFSGINQSYDIWEEGVPYLWLLPVAATIGHCWPIYLRFKGGKAVACYYGVMGGISYVNLAFCAITYLGILKMKKIVSFTSVISSFICLVIIYLLATIQYLIPPWNSGILFFNIGVGGLLYYNFYMAGAFTIMFIILVIRHSSNFKRLREGKESSIKWMK